MSEEETTITLSAYTGPKYEPLLSYLGGLACGAGAIGLLLRDLIGGAVLLLLGISIGPLGQYLYWFHTARRYYIGKKILINGVLRTIVDYNPRAKTITFGETGKHRIITEWKGEALTKHSRLIRSTRDEVRELTGINVPPAYTHVRIARDREAKLQATARTPSGKTAYFYHPEYIVSQQAAKWVRVAKLRTYITELVSEIQEAAKAGTPEALTLSLILQTGMRNGNRPQGVLRYDRKTGEAIEPKASYGASSLLLLHVTLLEAGMLVFDFPGKHGVPQHFEVVDSDLAAYVAARLLTEPRPLRLFDHEAKRTLEFLRTFGPDLKVHDLRAWYATELALAFREALRAEGIDVETEAAKRSIAKHVAKQLGNTAAAVRNAYMDPTL